jgi:hypothetical protein
MEPQSPLHPLFGTKFTVQNRRAATRHSAPLCSNCGSRSIAAVTHCFDDWCSECDDALWSTRDSESDPVHHTVLRTVECQTRHAWQHWLQFIPFSSSVCVAGSVGTWFAHQNLTGAIPTWSPSDIDVFINESHEEFRRIVWSVAVAVLTSPLDKERLMKVRQELMCDENRIVGIPTGSICISCIRATLSVSSHSWVTILLNGFDISVCKVSLNRQHQSAYYIEMNDDVAKHILLGFMEVVFKPSTHIWQRSYQLNTRHYERLKKYEGRGYRLLTMTFAVPKMDVQQFVGVFLADDQAGRLQQDWEVDSSDFLTCHETISRSDWDMQCSDAEYGNQAPPSSPENSTGRAYLKTSVVTTIA